MLLHRTRRRFLATLATLSLVGLAPAGCQKNDSSQSKAARHTRSTQPGAAPSARADLEAPLATVDDVVITVGELQERLNRQSPYVRNRYTSLEQKREFLDSLIRFEVLAAEADRRGYATDPEVVRTMKQVMIQRLMKDEFEAKVTPESISDAEVRTYYDAHLDEFVVPEQIRVSAIVVKSRAQAQRVAAEAAGEGGKTNKAFRDLVGRYSTDDTTKLRGGDLRYLTRDATDWPRPVVDAAFKLVSTGDVSGAVDAGDGTWWILKQTGHKRAVTRTLADATQQIRNKLYRERRIDSQKQFIDALRAKAKVEVDESNLSRVRVDTSTVGGDPHGQAQPLPDLNSAGPGALPQPVPPPIAPSTTP